MFFQYRQVKRSYCHKLKLDTHLMGLSGYQPLQTLTAFDRALLLQTVLHNSQSYHRACSVNKYSVVT